VSCLEVGKIAEDLPRTETEEGIYFKQAYEAWHGLRDKAAPYASELCPPNLRHPVDLTRPWKDALGAVLAEDADSWMRAHPVGRT
jgi:hypothetical protein